MRDPSPDDIDQLYEAGVSAVQDATAGFDSTDWARPACGHWDANDTVRHLVGVADWYHAWLDRAHDGDASAPFDPSEFGERNRIEIAERRHLDGPEAVARFVERARSYLARAVRHRDLPYGFPAGTTTVGLHLGVAATEWHLHAWDLTRGSPTRHAPADADQLLIAAGSAMAGLAGGVRGRVMRAALPLAARRSPWKTLLQRSGRS